MVTNWYNNDSKKKNKIIKMNDYGVIFLTFREEEK